MAKFYLAELLNDGEAHSKAEILGYIQEKVNGVGVDGKRLTDETISAAIWYGIRHGTANYTQISKGWFQKNPQTQSPLATDHAYKEAIYFLAEQARCLKRIGDSDSQTCIDAAKHLIGSDENLQNWLAEKTAVKRFFKDVHEQDYELEDFAGKDTALDKALEDLHEIAAGDKLPPFLREKLAISTDIIEGFYGRDMEWEQPSKSLQIMKI